MMTQPQNQGLKALPNVLRDQTVPNTLGGVGAPRPVARRRAPLRVPVAAAVGLALALAVALAALLARPA